MTTTSNHDQRTDRRRVLKAGIAVGGTVWVAPLLTTAPASAATGTAPPGPTTTVLPTTTVAPTGCSRADSRGGNFKAIPMAAGHGLWFNAVCRVESLGATDPIEVVVRNQSVRWTDAAGTHEVVLPDSVIRRGGSAPAGVTWDGTRWVCAAPAGFTSEVFMGGRLWEVPAGGLPGSANPVTWRATIDLPRGVKLSWRWSSAVYTQCPSEPASLLVKAIDGTTSTDRRKAGTPEALTAFLTRGGNSNGGTDYTGLRTGTGAVDCR